MPSSSAKQHRFMQAVAHSPSFAKKAGVSQSVGKDFSAADKSKTFSKGGTMKIRKFADAGYVDGEDGNQYRDYDPDKTYSGRSYDDETGGLAENTPTRSTAKAAPATPSRAPAARAAPAPAATASRSGVTPAQEAALVRREQETEISKREAAEDKGKSAPKLGAFSETGGRKEFRPAYANYDTPGYAADEVGAVTGRRGDPKYKRVVTDEQKAKNAENFAEVTAALIPMGGATATVARKLGQTGIRAAQEARMSKAAAETGLKAAQEARMSKAVADYAKGRTKEAQEAFKAANRNDRNVVAMERNSMFGSKDAARKYAESGGMKRGGSISRFAKGGTIIESKKMMGKEVAFMKKKGAPSSMIKHEKAEMGMKKGGMARGGMPPEVMAAMRAKQAVRQQPMRRPPPGGMPPPAQPPMGMKKGGAAKFAKGGGIESRGKTKGTIIRMAAGGSVSSRADGIAQRGKTKFTNY